MHGSIGTQGRCTDSGPGIGELKSGRAGIYVEVVTAMAEVIVVAVLITGLKVTLTSEYTISRDYATVLPFWVPDIDDRMASDNGP